MFLHLENYLYIVTLFLELSKPINTVHVLEFFLKYFAPFGINPIHLSDSNQLDVN